MNIQKYLAFVKTVEHRNIIVYIGKFTRSASALNYSQSGISRMISDLENHWKVSLLERNRSGVRLTSGRTRIHTIIKGVFLSFSSQELFQTPTNVGLSYTKKAAGSPATSITHIILRR